jgi:hypothetical protein
MGQVVPFIARVRDSGDWSATERARLEDLADRLASGGVHVEVIFGATDEGDPWCVVTDADGDVLIHVARIDGKFVVHSAIDDAVNESVDLHTALRERLAATEEAMAPTSAVVLPFTARQGQTFLALLAATAFFYETSAIGDTAEAGEPVPAPPPADPPPPPPEAETPTQERENAQGVALQPSEPGPAPMLVAAPPGTAAPTAPTTASPPPAVETPRAATTETLDLSVSASTPTAPAAVIQGTAGDDLLVGTAADEHIVGGDGDDTLQGGGGRDLLEGGAGNDIIEVTGEATAVGGTGADTFVIHAPVHSGAAETLLGVVFDYSGLEGDRVVGFGGRAVHFLPRPRPDADKQAPVDGQTTTPKPDPDFDLTPPTLGDFGTTVVGPRPPLTRVDVDLDGDGMADGYLLFGTRGPPPEPPPIDATVGAGLGADSFG